MHQDDILETLTNKIIRLSAYVTGSEFDKAVLNIYLEEIKHLWRAALQVQTLNTDTLVEGTVSIRSDLSEIQHFHYLAEASGNARNPKLSEIVLSINRPQGELEGLAFNEKSLESHTQDELERILSNRIRLIFRRYWKSQEKDVKNSLMDTVYDCFQYEKWYAKAMEDQLNSIEVRGLNQSKTLSPLNLQCNDSDFQGCYENMLLLVLSSNKRSELEQEEQLRKFSQMMVEMFSGYRRIVAYFDTDHLIFFNQAISSTIKLLLPREAKRLHGQYFDDFFTIHPVFPELEALIKNMQRISEEPKKEVAISEVVDFVFQATQLYSEQDSKCTYYEKCFADIFRTYIAILSEHGGEYAVYQDSYYSKIRNVCIKWQNRPITVRTWNEELRSLCKLMFSEPSESLSISPSPEMRYAILRFKREFNIKTEYLQIWYRLMERRLCDAELVFIWNKYYLNHSLRKWFEKLHRHHVATGQAMLLNNMRFQRMTYRKWTKRFATVSVLRKKECTVPIKKFFSKITTRYRINQEMVSRSESIASWFVMGSYFKSWILLSRRGLQMQKVKSTFSLKLCFSTWQRKHVMLISMDQNASHFRDSLVAGRFLLRWSSRLQGTSGLLGTLEKRETTFVKKKFWNLWVSRRYLYQRADAFRINTNHASMKRLIRYWRQRTQEENVLSTYYGSWELSVKRAVLIKWRHLYQMSLESNRYRTKHLLSQAMSRWRLVIQEKKFKDKLASLTLAVSLKKWKLSASTATLHSQVNFATVRQCFLLWTGQYASMVEKREGGTKFYQRLMLKRCMRMWKLKQRKSKAACRSAEVILQGHLAKGDMSLTAHKFYGWVDAFVISVEKNIELDDILYKTLELRLLRSTFGSWKEESMTAKGNVAVADEFRRLHRLKRLSGHWLARAERVRELDYMLSERLEEKNAQTLFDLFPKWNIRYIKLQRLYSSAEQFLFRWNNNKKRSIFQIWLENTQQRQSSTVRRRRSIQRKTKRLSFSRDENVDFRKDAKLHIYSPAEKPRYTPIAELGPFIEPSSTMPVSSNPPIATPHRRPWNGPDFVPATERIRRFKTQQLKKRYQEAGKSATPSPEKVDQDSPTRKVSSFKDERAAISRGQGEILSPKVSPIFVLRQRLQNLKSGPLRPNLVDEPGSQSRFESDSGSSTIIE